jgi:hypothetical protein
MCMKSVSAISQIIHVSSPTISLIVEARQIFRPQIVFSLTKLKPEPVIPCTTTTPTASVTATDHLLKTLLPRHSP